MPEIGGYEATKIIRSLTNNPNQSIPIIALTASALTEDIDFAYQIGITSYLTKPFTPEQLREILEQNLSSNKNTETIVAMLSEHPKTDQEEIDYLQPDYLSKIYGNDKKYAADMFEIFLETVPKHFAQLRPLVEEEKISEIGKLAHQIKPSFTMVGLPELTQSFQDLERLAKQNDHLQEIRDLFVDIEQTFNKKITLVIKELEKLKAAN
jgi:HPt (histidine-containing phosphotransfer) domain-containing protein